MTYAGRCYCGAIRYQVDGEPKHVSICHCNDCRMNSGAPMVAWAGFPDGALTVTQGKPKTINRSGSAFRSFCADCGTGLFYRNAEFIPGVVDIQTATLDDPNAIPPAIQIQTAERLGWMKTAHELPEFARFPE